MTPTRPFTSHKRAASSSSSSEASKETGGSSGFFGTFFDKRQDISPQTTAHSAQLSMTRHARRVGVQAKIKKAENPNLTRCIAFYLVTNDHACIV